jgi:hypothetical protein
VNYLVILEARLMGCPSHTAHDLIDARTCADAEALAVAA